MCKRNAYFRQNGRELGRINCSVGLEKLTDSGGVHGRIPVHGLLGWSGLVQDDNIVLRQTRLMSDLSLIQSDAADE